jgi:hypothetical protein
MAETLEGRPREIIEGKNYAHLAIPRRDGTVQSVMVWAHTDGTNVNLNSAEGRGWPQTLRQAKTATVLVTADNNPYEWVAVTGSLVKDTHDGADAEIDMLAKKYLDADSYPLRKAGEVRISFALSPDRVHYNAPM